MSDSSVSGVSASMSDILAASIQKFIKAVDTDGDGKVSKTEFSAILKSTISNSKVDADTLFSELDTNSDGNIDADELAAYLKKNRPAPPPPPPPPDILNMLLSGSNNGSVQSATASSTVGTTT